MSVIMPVYNRRENLYLALCALDCAMAHYKTPLEVIVSDDGSEDNALGVMLEFRSAFDFKYLWQPHRGYRASKAYNAGCAMASSDTFFLLGSDILIEPTTLVHLWNLHLANPRAIIAGRYDWMLPMQIRPYDVYHHWDQIVNGTLPPAQFGAKADGIIGVDPRYLAAPALFDEGKPQTEYASLLFADLMLFPKDIYASLGGFDENMIGHGGQDCELSIRAQLAGYPVIFSNLVRGFHVYHTRDQAANRATLASNIQYIAAKHDLAAVGLYINNSEGNMSISQISK
jgi:GT2 family glycosyltransferase